MVVHGNTYVRGNFHRFNFRAKRLFTLTLALSRMCGRGKPYDTDIQSICKAFDFFTPRETSHQRSFESSRVEPETRDSKPETFTGRGSRRVDEQAAREFFATTG